MNRIAAIRDPKGTITAIVGGKTFTIPADFPTYSEVMEAIKDQEIGAFLSSIDAGESFKKRSEGKVSVVNNRVVFNGQQVHNVVASRILDLAREGFDFSAMVAFLENCFKNPTPSSIDELYLFLEANRLPLTPDGCFLAYRRVGPDYLSIHCNPDGTRNRNKVGDVVKMDRKLVNPNRNETCSRGLHFASLSYMPSYPGEKIMIVKLNPINVVTIPSDYNNQKGRCCEYKVVAEHTEGDVVDSLLESPVYAETATGVTPTGGKYAVRRGKNGRFLPAQKE